MVYSSSRTVHSRNAESFGKDMFKWIVVTMEKRKKGITSHIQKGESAEVDLNVC